MKSARAQTVAGRVYLQSLIILRTALWMCVWRCCGRWKQQVKECGRGAMGMGDGLYDDGDGKLGQKKVRSEPGWKILARSAWRVVAMAPEVAASSLHLRLRLRVSASRQQGAIDNIRCTR